MKESEVLELAPLLARRELWLLVSVGFADPYQRERFELLRDASFRQRAVDAAALLRQEHTGVVPGPGEVSPGELAPERFFAAVDAGPDNLEASFRELFGLTAISPRCPPCEIEYEPNPDIAYRAQRLADVAGFYQAFGMQLSFHAVERLDHITVEAEFLYLLLAKEAAARHTGNLEGAAICAEARRKFFSEHVGWWLPAFARLVARSAPVGYYQELAQLTAALAAAERLSLGLPVFPARVVPKPSGDETEAGCFECINSESG